MSQNDKVKLRLTTGERDHHGRIQYHKTRRRIFMTGRPALMRYKVVQRDGGTGKVTGQASSYFIREDYDTYRELSPEETERILKWLAVHESNPNVMTIEQVTQALAAPVIEPPEDSATAEAREILSKRTEAGIILPGGEQ